MYCLRLLFYKNYIVVIVVCSLKSMCIQSFILIGCCVSELHGHLCPYRNVLPEAVLQELHCLPNCLHVCMIRVEVAITSPSFVTLYLMVSEIAKSLPEAVYCCFTRTTLFTKLFICFYNQSYRLLSLHQVLLLYTLWFLR